MRAADLLTALRNAVAEFGGDAPMCELPEHFADVKLDDGYERDRPNPAIGGGKRVIVAYIDEHGIGFRDLGRKQEGDDTLDIHRENLRRIYTKRKKEWAELSAKQERELHDRSNR